MITLHFPESNKYVVRTRIESQELRFDKLYPENYMTFNEEIWDYEVFDSYELMSQAYPDSYSPDFPPPDGYYPPEEFM